MRKFKPEEINKEIMRICGMDLSDFTGNENIEEMVSKVESFLRCLELHHIEQYQAIARLAMELRRASSKSVISSD